MKIKYIEVVFEHDDSDDKIMKSNEAGSLRVEGTGPKIFMPIRQLWPKDLRLASVLTDIMRNYNPENAKKE